MKQQNPESYFTAIKGAYPEASNFQLPPAPGIISPTFFADTRFGKRVFKFNDSDMVFRNVVVSSLLSEHDIPAPKIRPHFYNNHHFESYPYIPHLTLFEFIQKNGMAQSQKEDLFKDMLRIQYKVSQINTSSLKALPYINSYEVQGYTNLKRHSSIMLSGLVQKFSWLISRGPQFLYHNDTNEKNILVTQDGKFSGLIDLDSIALSSEEYYLTHLALRWAPTVFSLPEILDLQQNLSGYKIEQKKVEAYIKLFKHWRQVKAAFAKIR